MHFHATQPDPNMIAKTMSSHMKVYTGSAVSITMEQPRPAHRDRILSFSKVCTLRKLLVPNWREVQHLTSLLSYACG